MYYLADTEVAIQDKVKYDSEDNCNTLLNASLTKGSLHLREDPQETGTEMQDTIATEVISFTKSANSSSETESLGNVSEEVPNKPMAEIKIFSTTDDAHYVSRTVQHQHWLVNTCQSAFLGRYITPSIVMNTTVDPGKGEVHDLPNVGHVKVYVIES